MYKHCCHHTNPWLNWTNTRAPTFDAARKARSGHADELHGHHIHSMISYLCWHKANIYILKYELNAFRWHTSSNQQHPIFFMLCYPIFIWELSAYHLNFWPQSLPCSHPCIVIESWPLHVMWWVQVVSVSVWGWYTSIGLLLSMVSYGEEKTYGYSTLDQASRCPQARTYTLFTQEEHLGFLATQTRA